MIQLMVLPRNGYVFIGLELPQPNREYQRSKFKNKEENAKI